MEAHGRRRLHPNAARGEERLTMAREIKGLRTETSITPKRKTINI